MPAPDPPALVQPPVPVAAPAASEPKRGERPSPALGSEPPQAPAVLSLEQAWLKLLGPLSQPERIMIHDVGFPVSLEGGLLRVGIRKEQWRLRLRDALGQADLASVGARRVEVIAEAEKGTTGRESLAAADLQRRAAARAAAEGADGVKRLIAAFDAELEEVTPIVLADVLDVPVVEEVAEDYAAAGGSDG